MTQRDHAESGFEPGDQSDDCDVICPHCGYAHQAEPSDGDGEEHPQERQCDECGKAYVMWAEYSVTYHTKANQ